MRLTRYILVIVLLCTAIVMLTNMMVPHHHHHHQVCFISGHCKGEKACHDDARGHDDLDHSHQHPVQDHCNVTSVYIVPALQKEYGKIFSSLQQKEYSQLIVTKDDTSRQGKIPELGHFVFCCWQTGQAFKILVRSLRAPPPSS